MLKDVVKGKEKNGVLGSGEWEGEGEGTSLDVDSNSD